MEENEDNLAQREGSAEIKYTRRGETMRQRYTRKRQETPTLACNLGEERKLVDYQSWASESLILETNWTGCPVPSSPWMATKSTF